ncbi:hypothetical protein SAMN04487949_3518 [Halogranum gelatinilyticum]|uniref:Uncharacterized protein n=1 Tax=Halogranum gelatinilyticum TaxID=660521 RepID=A0A1G9Z239_9EURY|nr:hypothetical protein [Halogranum gelatinilyticum]SDN15502.1 hypothetical protein SAMN04487949_3518 [Halogranum gelatinilyticum]
MVQQAAQQITEFLRDRAGRGLRTVVIVRDENYDVHYLRSDLEAQYSDETFSEVVDIFRLDSPFLAPDVNSNPVGERRAIIHYHERAFIIQFPFSETESILISLSRDAGRDLLQFIEKCRSIVHDGQ